MKTLALFAEIGGQSIEPKFKVLDGDFRHLNNIYIGLVGTRQESEEQLMDQFPEDSDFLTEPTKDWDYFIHCGYIM